MGGNNQFNAITYFYLKFPGVPPNEELKEKKKEFLMHFQKSYTMLAAGVMLVSVSVACVQSPEQKSYDDESKVGTITSYGGGGGGGATMVNVPISIEHKVFGLAGTAATAYDVTLAGCLSGYGASVDETNVDGVEVYKDDRSCLAKLTAFTAGGVDYAAANPGATDFTLWTANDTAYFTNAGNTAKIAVKVISQLASPISGTEAVVYNFSELLDGTGDYVFSEAEVSDAHTITVESQEAPHFDVIAATYVGADDTTGEPQLSFKLECVDDPTAGSPNSIAMTDGAPNTNNICGNVNLTDVTYKLIKDTYSSVLTISDADTIFGVAGQAVTLPTDQYQTDATHEGFNTITLDGPGPLGTAGNQNMILILKAGISYTYYNIDITTITQ